MFYAHYVREGIVCTCQRSFAPFAVPQCRHCVV
jgi:hypothetical protein